MVKVVFKMKPIKRRFRIRRKVTWQTGKTIIPIDKKRTALVPGWRTSKSNHEYYEARANRSDKDPKKRL
jgi:hypothetical protein